MLFAPKNLALNHLFECYSSHLHRMLTRNGQATVFDSGSRSIPPIQKSSISLSYIGFMSKYLVLRFSELELIVDVDEIARCSFVDFVPLFRLHLLGHSTMKEYSNNKMPLPCANWILRKRDLEVLYECNVIFVITKDCFGMILDHTMRS